MTSVRVRGIDIDDDTRCAHYHTERDVVAFRFDCCDGYFPCFRCHEELTDHEAVPWPRDRFDEPSVLCGVCRTELAAPEYLECEYQCPACSAAFNPDCAAHAELYFETEE